MQQLVCPQCKELFYRNDSWVRQADKRQQRLFCSAKCRNDSNRTAITVECLWCKKQITVNCYQYKKKKTKLFGCSRRCWALFRQSQKQKICRVCGKPTSSKFCGNACYRENIWQQRKKEIEYSGYVQIGKSEEYNRKLAKKFLLETKERRCEICNLTKWMGKDIPLVLDHIDGNSVNYALINLRLICGNCNMQLDTFAGKNRGQGRDFKKIRYHEKKRLLKTNEQLVV